MMFGDEATPSNKNKRQKIKALHLIAVYLKPKRFF